MSSRAVSVGYPPDVWIAGHRSRKAMASPAPGARGGDIRPGQVPRTPGQWRHTRRISTGAFALETELIRRVGFERVCRPASKGRVIARVPEKAVARSSHPAPRSRRERLRLPSSTRSSAGMRRTSGVLRACARERQPSTQSPARMRGKQPEAPGSAMSRELAVRGYNPIDTDGGWCEPLPGGRHRWREGAIGEPSEPPCP